MSPSEPPRSAVPRIAYTVSARHPSEESAKRYVEWLHAGHTAAVIRGGASTAEVLRRLEGATPVVHVRYVFPSREVFDRYVREYAPALRAEGLELFGPGSGVEFARTIEEIAEQSPGATA